MCPILLTTWSSLTTLSMSMVFKVLKFKITSLMNAFSWLLLGGIVNFDDGKTSSIMGISMESGAWSEKSQFSGEMWWLSSSDEPFYRNIRSRTEFASPDISEYLVGQGLVVVDKNKLNESAMINKLSLIVEWWGKLGSYKWSLMLKSPVMMSMLSIFTSVFFRYFKAVWEELEYMFKMKKYVLSLKKKMRLMSLWLMMSLWSKNQRGERRIFT